MATYGESSRRTEYERLPARDTHRRYNVGSTERTISTLAGAALLLGGIRRGHGLGLLLAGTGAMLLKRGVTGVCEMYQALGIDTSEERSPATAVPAQQGRKIDKSIIIQRPQAELFDFWSKLENLPRIMKHLITVEEIDATRSHWKARGPLDTTLEWEADVILEREGEMISWRSVPGSEVETAGSVHFRALPDGRSTELRVTLKYNPPGGKLVAGLAEWTGQGLERELDEDLHRFKEFMETGQVAATENQPPMS